MRIHTARRIVNSVISYGIYEKACKTDGHRDQSHREDTNKGDLLSLVELQSPEDEEGKAKY